MKNYHLLVIFLFTFFFGVSQSPDKVSYQAVVRDGNNSLITNSNVGVEVTIYQGSVTGTVVYTEEHTVTSNDNGLITLEIGQGTAVNGDFSTIDWGNGPYFLGTGIDPTGGTNYSITTVSQMMSVPYALYSKESGKGIEEVIDNGDGTLTFNYFDGSSYTTGVLSGLTGPQGPAGNDGVGISSTVDNGDGTFTFNYTNGSSFTTSDLTGPPGPQGAQGPQGTQGPQGAQGPVGNDGVGITSTVDNGDGTFTFTYSDGSTFTTSDLTGPAGVGVPQTISQSGNTVTLSNSGGSITINDADDDPNNEIQNLSLSNDTIFLSNGGFVKLPQNSNISSSTSRVGFASSTNWACPQGVTQITVQLWGASGGGGGGDWCVLNGSTNSYGCQTFSGGNISNGGDGGSGGNGGYIKQVYNVVPGNTYSIVIGNGGSGGNAGTGTWSRSSWPSNGSAGGQSSFDGSIIAAGGSGGTRGLSSLGNCSNGGSGSNGSITNFGNNSTSSPSSSSPRSYIPVGYTTVSVTPSQSASGGNGGNGGSQAFTSGFDNGSPGQNGTSGYCVISY